ncbi:MAG: ABC transporter substrate-binding protein [Planctomycetes bacterium]|nr:ABC transporter substrate-binding protein [Planctomycetota bacterium]
MNRTRGHLGLPAALLVLSSVLALSACDRRTTHQTPNGVPASQPTLRQANYPDRVMFPEIDEAERNSPAMRIVSLSPAATEICCALGLRAALVGRTSYCVYPPEVSAVEIVGTLLDVRAETLLQRKPDLVLFSGTSRSQVERLEPLKLKMESLPDSSLADVFAAIRRAGELTGRPRTAETLCRNLDQDIAQIVNHVAKSKGRRVLVAIEPLADPPRAPHVAGKGSFFDELLRRAGYVNIVDSPAAFAPLSLEAIARADPDVIIELAASANDRPEGDAGALAAWRNIGQLKAIRRHSVRVLTGQEFFLPGPRVPLLLERMCEAIERDADE